MVDGNKTWFVRHGDAVEGPLSIQQLWQNLSSVGDLSELEVRQGTKRWQAAGPVHAKLLKHLKSNNTAAAAADSATPPDQASVVPPPRQHAEPQWYMRVDGAEVGPLAQSTLIAKLIRFRGQGAAVRQLDSESWSDGDTVLALLEPEREVAYDVLHSTRTALAHTSQAVGTHVPGIMDWIRGFLINARRGLASDFGTLTATEEERVLLVEASDPIQEPLAQDYAAWRKCLLWVVAAFALTGFALQLFDKLTMKSDGFQVVSYFNWGLLSLQGLATVLITLGAANWANLNESRKFVRFAWISLFLGPLLMCLIPWKSFGSLSEQDLQKVAMQLTGIALINIVPKIFGLMPGMIRACLTLRTLVPESSAPGWLALMVAPAYSLMFLVSAAISLQLPISSLWSIGFLFLAGAPLVVIAHVGEINAPTEPTNCYQLIRRIRRLMLIGVTVGVATLAVAIFKQLDFREVPLYNLLTALCGAVASAFLLSVVAADFLIAAMYQAFLMGTRNAESPLAQDLRQKFDSLASVGLTDLGAGETELARHIGAGVRSAAQRGKAWALAEADLTTTDSNQNDVEGPPESSTHQGRWAD